MHGTDDELPDTAPSVRPPAQREPEANLLLRHARNRPWPPFEARLFMAVEERLRTALGADHAAARAEGESRLLKDALATAREALTLAL